MGSSAADTTWYLGSSRTDLNPLQLEKAEEQGLDYGSQSKSWTTQWNDPLS
jgi:hypothetical protein